MEDNLWNDIKKDSVYLKNKELYQNHIMEQYKLYVEMADRISSRRNLTNVFFLTLNTSIIAGIGFSLEKLELEITTPILLIFISTITILIVDWWWLLRSYRNLNSAKYKVIGHIEKRLPSSPYWKAEWRELGFGKDIRKYLPLSLLESFVPFVFLIIYLAISYLIVV